jgi:hypothetical protein
MQTGMRGLTLAECRVDVTKLRDHDPGKVDELRKFLEAKVGVTINTSGNELVMKFEKEEASLMRRRFLKEALRKFLHRANLKEDFRVISGGEKAFIIKDKEKREIEE